MEILVGILAGILLIILAVAILYLSNENIWAEALGFAIFTLGAIFMIHPVLVRSELPPAETPIRILVDPAVKDKITTNTIQIQIVLPPTQIQK